MRRSVFWQTVSELRRPLLHWTLGLAVAPWLVLLARPLLWFILGDQAGLGEGPGWLAFLLGDAASLKEPGQWMYAAGFGIVLPSALIIFMIYMGSWLVAGEEERNTLGLLLAVPLQRYRLIFEKFAVLILAALAPSAAVWLALSLIGWLGWIDVGGAALAGASALLFLVGLAFGAAAMALGSLTGRRRLSFNVILALALLMLIISRAPSSSPVQPVLRFFSLFSYYYAALLDSFYWLNALILFLTAAAGLIFAWSIFEHRDLPV